MRICAFGDLLLDVVVRPDGPIRPDTDTYGQTSLVLGGQTANVAAWTVALGGAGRLLAARADDLAGRPIAGELQRVGVELVGPLLAGRTGSVVSISTPDGGRTMLIDRGVAAALAPATLEACWVAGCDWLYAFGYALAAEPCRRAALSAAALARDSGARVALDIASVGALAAAGRAMPEACAALSADVVLATEAERAALPGLTAPTAVVKRAAAGVVVEMQGTIRTLPALPATLVDATGAGDAGRRHRRRRRVRGRASCSAASSSESEARVRAAGAVPATVGVVDGTIRVGLERAEIERFESARSASATWPTAHCAASSARRRSAARPPARDERRAHARGQPRADRRQRSARRRDRRAARRIAPRRAAGGATSTAGAACLTRTPPLDINTWRHKDIFISTSFSRVRRRWNTCCKDCVPPPRRPGCACSASAPTVT